MQPTQQIIQTHQAIQIQAIQIQVIQTQAIQTQAIHPILIAIQSLMN